MPRNPIRSAVESPNVTIRDVAAAAGVSVATVSRVFNQKGPIAPVTVQRVLDIARNLRYVPHAGARSLSTRSTRTIGVVLPDLHGEFFSEVIRGIDVAARQSGYHVLLSGSHSDREEMHAVVKAVRGLVDGLIVMSPDLEATTLLTELPPAIPAVMLNSRVRGRASIRIDNAGGARKLVRHLHDCGHSRIGFISGPALNADADERLRGYRLEIRVLALGTIRPLEIQGNFTEESGYEAAKAFLAMPRRPTAIFAANDSMAIGALSALREAGVDVPGEMALAGFDDIPIARFLTPALTTVKVPIAELGRKSFELLMDAASGVRSKLTLPTELVVRSSSCAAPTHPGSPAKSTSTGSTTATTGR
jgi:LacI family transcriptional regulator